MPKEARVLEVGAWYLGADDAPRWPGEPVWPEASTPLAAYNASCLTELNSSKWSGAERFGSVSLKDGAEISGCSDQPGRNLQIGKGKGGKGAVRLGFS